jgi:hypothetical protein
MADVPKIYTVQMSQIKRGRQEKKTIQTSDGEFNAGIFPGQGLAFCQSQIDARPFWVIIYAKSGKVSWSGKLKSVRSVAGYDHFFWSFTVDNTLNNSPDGAGEGSDEITVTVVNPDSGPSTPVTTTTDIVQVN